MGFTCKGSNSDAVAARRVPTKPTRRASSGRPLPKQTRGDVTGATGDAAVWDKMLRGEEGVPRRSGAQPP